MTTTLSTNPAEQVTYKIAGWAIPDLEKAFEKLAKRAARIGVPAPTFTIVGSVDEPEMVPDLSYNIDGALVASGRTKSFKLVTVSGEAPSYDGWQMIAVIDRDVDEAPDGPHVVNVFNGFAADPAWRFAPDFCDYCAEQLNRTHPQGRKTLVVVEKDGPGRKIVGTTCLKDFLGHKAPDAIAGWLETLSGLNDLLGGFADLDDDGWESGGGGGGEYRYSPTGYLAWVAATIRQDGWVPRSAARYGEAVATADAAATALHDFAKGRKNGRNVIDPPTDNDRELAELALDWAQEIEITASTNDYLANVASVAFKGGWRSRDLGLGASIISAYKRAQEQELARKQRAEDLSGSQHLGAVKQRLDVAGTIIFDRDFDGAYGVTRLFKILTDDGNLIVWWASNGGPWVKDGDNDRQLTQGDRVAGKATVKKHDEYEGVKQTVVTRAALTLQPTKIKELS